MRHLAWVAVVLSAVVLSAVALSSAATTRTAWTLTGTWNGSGGAVLEVTQPSATSIHWFGHSADGKTWGNDFTGTITGNIITGSYVDRAGYTNSPLGNHGDGKFRIDNNCHLSTIEVTIIGTSGSSKASGEGFTKARCVVERDTVAPVVVALPSQGTYPRAVKLKFKLRDNSGRAKAGAVIFQRTKPIRRFPYTALVRAQGATYWFTWKPPAKFKDGIALTFCVSAVDAAGNKGSDCAALSVIKL